MTKRFKQKLVFEIGSDCESPSDIPMEYSNNKLRWLCDIIVEGRDRIVDEYSIAPDRKIYLEDFLNIVHKEIDKIINAEAVHWGIKMYRLTPKKR